VFVLSLAALTYFALRQHAPPQFAAPASPFSWRWWLLPREQNVSDGSMLGATASGVVAWEEKQSTDSYGAGWPSM